MIKKHLKTLIAPRIKPLVPYLKNIETKFLEHGYRSPFRGRTPSLRQKISLVVPTYNVEQYFDEFMRSVVNQSTGLHNVEVIIVDDGSPDNSAALAKKWQASYPNTIKYVYQENKGLSGARNTGIEHATGEWISFPDPDDFLNRHYFHYVNQALSLKRDKPLVLLSCNLIMYYEETGKFSNRHPLNYKYQSNYSEVDANDLGNYIQLSAASSFIHLKTLVDSKIIFDSRIKPTFEDGFLINLLLSECNNHSAGFIKKSKYYYRRRKDDSSLVFGARVKPAWYIDQIRFGYLELLKRIKEKKGEVPYFIQRTVLYDIAPRYRHLINHPERVNFLSTEQKKEFIQLMEEVFTYIDADTIRSMTFGAFNEEERIGLLITHKQDNRSYDYLYVRNYDDKNNAFQFSVFGNDDAHKDVTIFVNGVPASQFDHSKYSSTFLDKPFVTENRFWIEAPSNATVCATISQRPARLRRGSRNLGDRVSSSKIITSLKEPAPSSKTLPPEANRLREYAKSDIARSRYENCWLLMDRDDVADDNAEHLYRYMIQTDKAQNVYFVLRQDSLDWDRLSSDGFNLLTFGSDEHVAALINAKVLASSHAANIILWPVNKKWIADLLNYKFIFLQHGITKDDISRAVGKRPFDLFITAAKDEYDSIAGTSSNYLFTPREVKLTGFPRHDALKKRNHSKNTILVMPTWRNSLTVMDTSKSVMPGRVDNFFESDFAIAWLELLTSDKLRELAITYSADIVFCPHPNMSIYLPDMNLPSWVKSISPLDKVSYQTLFSDAAVLITDYSSVAFDCAYIDKPIVYYQFDNDTFFDSDHGYRRGYYDYYEDGFGPVTTDLSHTLEGISLALNGKEKPEYAKRRAEFFAFRNGKCSERVYNVIKELITPQ